MTTDEPTRFDRYSVVYRDAGGVEHRDTFATLAEAQARQAYLSARGRTSRLESTRGDS